MANVALILANPVAKRGEQAVREAVGKLAAAYQRQNRDVVVRYTEQDGAREAQIVSEFADQAETIVAVGGDGTTRRVAKPNRPAPEATLQQPTAARLQSELRGPECRGGARDAAGRSGPESAQA